MKKFVAGILTLAICASVFAGCTNGDSSSASSTVSTGSEAATASGDSSAAAVDEGGNVTPVGEFPIVKEAITLKIMGQKDPGAPDWDELVVFKKLSEITNINFEFQLYEKDVFAEQKNIALVSGDYADIIVRNIATDAIPDEENYGPQGMFIDLKDLIDNYAPNIKSLMDSRADVKASMVALDGKIYGLPYVFETATTQAHTGFFDEQWMTNVGIEKVPETTDELYEMLVAFKEQDANGNGDANDEIPFTAVGLTTTMRDLLIPAFTGQADGLSFGIGKDGKVVYTPALPEYKEFLTYANKLYSEGLLDPEFPTQTSQQWQAKVKANVCGVYSASPTSRDAETTTTQQLSLPPLTSATNSEKIARRPFNLYPGRGIITNACKEPIAAIRLLDMFYATPENEVEGFSGQTLFLGFENEQWKYADADKKTYEWIAPVTSFTDINKEISVNMELPGYLNFLAMPVNNPLMTMKVEQVNEMQKPYYTGTYPSNVRFTEAESERGNVIEVDIYNYVVMMTTKFIIGEESLDKFDEYTATLEKTGLSELVKIKEDALVRWNEAMAS